MCKMPLCHLVDNLAIYLIKITFSLAHFRIFGMSLSRMGGANNEDLLISLVCYLSYMVLDVIFGSDKEQLELIIVDILHGCLLQRPSEGHNRRILIYYKKPYPNFGPS